MSSPSTHGSKGAWRHRACEMREYAMAEKSWPENMTENMVESPILFDRLLWRRRRTRAAASSLPNFLLERVAGELADRLTVVLRQFDLAVDLGTPGDAVRSALGHLENVGTVIGTDVFPRARPFVVADEEALPFRDSAIDLVVSALTLQFVNDLPGVLLQIRRALKPDGLFVAALIGGDTLAELRQSFAAAESEIEGGISPRVAPFIDLREAGGLLQRAGLALPVADLERITVRYASVFDLLSDLRRMGATNLLVARRRTALRRTTLMRMMENYAQRFADPDGRLRATFDIVRNQRLVARRHRIVAQIARPHPRDLLRLPGRDKAVPAAANVKWHQQVEVGIEVARKGQRRQALLLDLDTELLVQFADKALLWPFAGFDFTAGKFP